MQTFKFNNSLLSSRDLSTRGYISHAIFLTFFSLFPLKDTSQYTDISHLRSIVELDISENNDVDYLSSIPALHKSILYYHVARTADGVFDIYESCERVLGFEEIVDNVSKKYGIPIDMFLGLILTESRGKPFAKSYAGALGIVQLMPQTAKQYGGYNYVSGALEDKRTDVYWSLETAAKILSKHYNSFGDWTLAFAAYHMGYGNMRTLRNMYYTTMGDTLFSMDQLYDSVPSDEVIAWLANKQDDPLGYLPKIYNAQTLLQLFREDSLAFLAFIEPYEKLDYRLRGTVAESIFFDADTYMTHDSIQQAIQHGLLQCFDNHNLVCDYVYEDCLHTDVLYVLNLLNQWYGKHVTVVRGLSAYDDDSDFCIDENNADIFGVCTTGRNFHISAPTNNYNFKKRQPEGCNDFYRLEYVLTLLRYHGYIVRRREYDDKKSVRYFHVTVLPG